MCAEMTQLSSLLLHEFMSTQQQTLSNDVGLFSRWSRSVSSPTLLSNARSARSTPAAIIITYRDLKKANTGEEPHTYTNTPLPLYASQTQPSFSHHSEEIDIYLQKVAL